jgi:serine/threonine-protein kinase
MANAPTTIGNFQLLRTLGEGGMGVVYEAEHMTMHRRAAIKLLRSELVRDPQAIRRFFNEARATNEVRHPGIVQIYDCGTHEDGSPWLIMELLEGETLARRIGRVGAMPAADVITLGVQAASVLEAAHRAGIIHRDLKPDNLFIVNNQETESGERVKVLDFGIAKLSSSASAKSMHTQTGMLMGTPLYMSPEQCRGTGQIDARSDIYSFGLILYQLLSGELPFVSEGMGELFDMQMNRPPPPLEKKVPGVNPALAATIEKMLRKDPAERVQTMGEVQRALLASAATPASAPPRPRVATPLAAVRSAAERSATNPSRTRPASANTTLSAGASEVDVDTITVPRSRLARPLGLLAALLVATGVVFVVRSLPGLKGHDSDEKTAPPVPVTAHAATAGTPSGPAKEAAAPAPREAPKPQANPGPQPKAAPGAAAPADRIMIDLKSSPSEARVVDSASGRLIGLTPLHHRLPRQTGTLEVRVEKSGYSSKSLTIPQDQDYHGSIRLERAAEAEPSGGEHIIKL